MWESRAMVSGVLGIEKANEFVVKTKQNFTANTGRLWNWQKRKYIIILQKIYGEGSSATEKGASNFLQLLPHLIENNNLKMCLMLTNADCFLKLCPHQALPERVI